MWYLLAYPLLGAIANRFRGGGIAPLPSEDPEAKRTQLRRITWAIVIGLMAANPWVGLVAFVICLPGWGFPVSAAIGKNEKPFEPEFAPLDWLATNLNVTGKIKDYGTIWLTLMGLTTGIILTAITGSYAYLMLAGMGLCYRCTEDGERGEFAFGALWGLAIAAATISEGIK